MVLTVHQAQVLDGEVDDGRVLLGGPVVLAKALDVQDQVRGQVVKRVLLDLRPGFLLLNAVELGEEACEGHLQSVNILLRAYLGDDVLFHLVREQRGWGQIQRQKEEFGGGGGPYRYTNEYSNVKTTYPRRSCLRCWSWSGC